MTVTARVSVSPSRGQCVGLRGATAASVGVVLSGYSHDVVQGRHDYYNYCSGCREDRRGKEGEREVVSWHGGAGKSDGAALLVEMARRAHFTPPSE